MNVFIDFQGFYIDKNKFMPKELAVLVNEKIMHCIFKPPFPFDKLLPEYQKQATWLMKNHHCIAWNDGIVPHWKFSTIVNNLGHNNSVIYVKGREKAKYLRKFIQIPVLELPESPAFEPAKPKCLYHHSDQCYCSLQKVYWMKSTHEKGLKKSIPC